MSSTVLGIFRMLKGRNNHRKHPKQGVTLHLPPITCLPLSLPKGAFSSKEFHAWGESCTGATGLQLEQDVSLNALMRRQGG